MKNNILLSILTPTYNRLLLLETGVINLIDQIKSARFENMLEILIGNDYQRDKTDKYLEHLKSKYEFIL